MSANGIVNISKWNQMIVKAISQNIGERKLSNDQSGGLKIAQEK